MLKNLPFSLGLRLALSIFSVSLSTLLPVNAQQVNKEAILQGAILAQAATQPTQFQSEKVQPGQAIQLSLLLENLGNSPNPIGKVFIRYALIKPLENQNESVVFETEKVDLPAILPYNSLEINFKEKHKWPSIPDFIREDWIMREYQAVVEIDGKKEIIGSLAITFSAYYYPGVRKEFPVKIPN